MTTISNKIEQDDIIVAGARSTGFLHIGNYFGAIRNFVNLTNDVPNKKYFFIADLHSLTTHNSPEELRKTNFITLATYLGCGLDPDKATIYLQSDIPYIHELYLYLNMFAYKGELERTATFKEKAKQNPNNINAGLLTYPVLMAADILIHKGTKVPVGKDQSQHVEMTRTFSNRFNHNYGIEYFKEAYAYNFSDELVNIPSLDNTGKMSKSSDPNSSINLTDSDDVIQKKIMKAVTDSGPKEPNSPLSKEVKNLLDIMKLVAPENEIKTFESAYADMSIRYGDLKKSIAQYMIQYIAPIREKIQFYLDQPEKVKEIAAEGAKKANANAKVNIEEIRDIMGLTSKNIEFNG